jgi:hypothetical protein
MSLDTSHITQWIRDATSARAEDRQAAAAFDRWLEESGSIPLISLHHIEELCSYNDTGLVRARLRFLGARKLVAWIGDGTADSGPTGIVAILREEVRAGYEAPAASLTEVRQKAARHLFRVGSGEDMLGPDPDIWLALGEIFAARTADARKMVALTRTDVIDIRDTPIRHLINGRWREGENLRRSLNLIRGTYATDIEKHGDRRIEDPYAVAGEFMQQVEAMAAALPRSPKSWCWARWHSRASSRMIFSWIPPWEKFWTWVSFCSAFGWWRKICSSLGARLSAASGWGVYLPNLLPEDCGATRRNCPSAKAAT